MISFDLKCDGDHIFEAWFRSSADYESQRAAGQLLCPHCGTRDVTKAVMAPAVAAKGNRRREKLPAPAVAPGASLATLPDDEAGQRIKALMRELADAQTQALKDSQWVGAAFAEQARAMHYGEAEQASIHGTASLQEARAMAEEGLSVAPLLIPIAPPDQTN